MNWKMRKYHLLVMQLLMPKTPKMENHWALMLWKEEITGKDECVLY